jgi:hypothetical protein
VKTRDVLLSAMAILTVAGCQAGGRRAPEIDEILHVSGARHGTLGPTGKRLFTERLDEGLGFRGQFSYIHYAKIAHPIIIELIVAGRKLTPIVESADWYPSHLAVRHVAGSVSVLEQKFITDDDTLVDVLTFTNRSSQRLDFDLKVTSACCQGQADPARKDRLFFIGMGDFHGVRPCFVLNMDLQGGRWPVFGAGWTRRIGLDSGCSLTATAAMSFSETAQDANDRSLGWACRPAPLAVHRSTFQQWFDDNCPRFECDDPYITKLYWYRWFVARHCLSRACTGNLPDPYFFEGTHQPHFPRLVSFSSPHIIAETRWLRDPQYAFGQVRNHCLNPDDTNKYFISARINEKGGDYNNWIVKAAWEAFKVHPDRQWLRSVIEAMSEDVRGTLRRFDRDGDYLPTPRNHGTTGMEFQPSFFYFNENYDDSKPAAPLERGDYAAYLYGNASSLVEAWRFLGDEARAAEFEQLAGKVRAACLAKLWDPKDRFCYAVREYDGAVARVREVVGFYPFMSRLFPDRPEYVASLAYLVDPAEFWTAYPPATVIRKCPAYTPHVANWPAAGGKTHGCMWNGPSWPHATSVILDVMAIALRDYSQPCVTPEHFWHMLDRYTHLQYENGDLDRPMVTEYYDGDSGSPDPTGCPDYFHSTYCDLVIRHVVGLQPANSDRVAIDPIPGPLKWFSLRGLRYRGHELDIVYNSADAGVGAGLTVRVDGRRAAHRPGPLGRVEFDLPGVQSARKRG